MRNWLLKIIIKRMLKFAEARLEKARLDVNFPADVYLQIKAQVDTTRKMLSNLENK